jgi:hypothetical protein
MTAQTDATAHVLQAHRRILRILVCKKISYQSLFEGPDLFVTERQSLDAFYYVVECHWFCLNTALVFPRFFCSAFS